MPKERNEKKRNILEDLRYGRTNGKNCNDQINNSLTALNALEPNVMTEQEIGWAIFNSSLCHLCFADSGQCDKEVKELASSLSNKIGKSREELIEKIGEFLCERYGDIRKSSIHIQNVNELANILLGRKEE